MSIKQTLLGEMPYGIAELEAEVHFDRQREKRKVKCFVRGCHRWLVPPGRKNQGDTCPEHGIRCHVSGRSPTYSYRDPSRNIIAGRHDFTSKLLLHPFKFESHRLGSERSEDALTWNVFRSLWENKKLASLARLFTGEIVDAEPQLFLWGISLDTYEPWPLLIATRRRFEQGLPSGRPFTEPDIALYLPGRYLVLVEAKFCSPNTYYVSGFRKSPADLTQAELIHRYWDRSLRIVDPDAASDAGRVPQQLWRNMVFAEYMAGLADHGTRAYHVNLVRDSFETQIEGEFHDLLHPEFSDRFRRSTWEQLFLSVCTSSNLEVAATYLRNKTAGLRPAFRISR